MDVIVLYTAHMQVASLCLGISSMVMAVLC